MSSTQVNLYRDPNANRCSLGVHLFKITKFEEKEGQQAPQWMFTCVCQDADPDNKGKTMTAFISLSEKARFMMDQFLDAVDAPNTHGTITGESFVNSTFRGLVLDDEYQGNFNRKITNYIKKGQELPKKLAETLAAQTKYAAKRATEVPKNTSTSLPATNGTAAPASNLPADVKKPTKAPF